MEEAVPLSLGALHGGDPSHGDHGGLAASETYRDEASHLVGMDGDVSVHVQDVQPQGFLLMAGHGLQPQEAWEGEAWLGVFLEEGLQEVALEVGMSLVGAYLAEEARTPGKTPRDWGRKAGAARQQTADGADLPGTAGSGRPGGARQRSRGARP